MGMKDRIIGAAYDLAEGYHACVKAAWTITRDTVREAWKPYVPGDKARAWHASQVFGDEVAGAVPAGAGLMGSSTSPDAPATDEPARCTIYYAACVEPNVCAAEGACCAGDPEPAVDTHVCEPNVWHTGKQAYVCGECGRKPLDDWYAKRRWRRDPQTNNIAEIARPAPSYNITPALGGLHVESSNGPRPAPSSTKCTHCLAPYREGHLCSTGEGQG